MTRKEAIEFIIESNGDVFMYGYDGVKVSRYDAMYDIRHMSDESWNDGIIEEVD